MKLMLGNTIGGHMGDSLLSHSLLHFCTNTHISRENLLSKEGMAINLKLNLKRFKPKYPYAFMYDAIHPHFLYIRMNSGKPSHELLCIFLSLYASTCMYTYLYMYNPQIPQYPWIPVYYHVYPQYTTVVSVFFSIISIYPHYVLNPILVVSIFFSIPIYPH